MMFFAGPGRFGRFSIVFIYRKLLFFIEEERIVRIKNWDGFPTNSIEQCLSYCNLKIDDFDHIVINSDPSSNLKQKLYFTLRNFYNISLFRDRLKSLLIKRKSEPSKAGFVSA